MSEIRQIVGRYEIVGRIGRGGMGVVHLARQLGLERNVALKELAALDAADPTFARRFLQEARVAGSMSHPNIVTVFDYFEDDGTAYIAMEYLELGSLRPFVSQLSVEQAIGVLEGTLAGLAHAHQEAVIHRDLKPENLLVTKLGGIKIADFGIAKALNAVGGTSLTATGMAIGSPTYMAPEQALATEIGPWTDLYALGIIGYELLVGRVPFAETDTPMAILWKQVHEPVPSPRSVRPDLDPRLAAWLERLLAKEPAKRPASAHEAWASLEEIVVDLGGYRWRSQAGLVGTGPGEPRIEIPPSFPLAEEGRAADPEEEDRYETYDRPLTAARRPPPEPPSAPEPPAPPAYPPPAFAEGSEAPPGAAFPPPPAPATTLPPPSEGFGFEPPATAPPSRSRRIWFLAAAVGALAVAAVGTLLLLGRDGTASDAPGGVASALAAAGCTFETFPSEGIEHVGSADQFVDYKTFPPTSGPHYYVPAIWDVYDSPLNHVQAVHNLEHGGVVIQYGGDVPRREIERIEEFYRDDPNGMIVAPQQALGDRIALTAWTRMAKCGRFDEDAFSAFRDAYRARGPERFGLAELQPGGR